MRLLFEDRFWFVHIALREFIRLPNGISSKEIELAYLDTEVR